MVQPRTGILCGDPLDNWTFESNPQKPSEKNISFENSQHSETGSRVGPGDHD